MILGMIYGLIPLCIGYVLYPYISRAQKKSDVSVWLKLAILVFVSPIAGIILFFMRDKDFEKDNINVKKTVLAIIGAIVALVILVTALVIALLNAKAARIDREEAWVLALLQKREDGHFYADWTYHYFTVTYADGRTKEGKITKEIPLDDNDDYYIEEVTENYVYFYDYKENYCYVYRCTHSLEDEEFVLKFHNNDIGLWGVLNDEEMYLEYESDRNYYIYNIADGTSEKYGHGLDSPAERKYMISAEYASKWDEMFGTNPIYYVKDVTTGEIHHLPQKEIHANICANNEEMAFIEENDFYNNMDLIAEDNKVFAKYYVSGYVIYYLYDFETETFTYYSYVKDINQNWV
jgi:hypothetical protein